MMLRLMADYLKCPYSLGGEMSNGSVHHVSEISIIQEVYNKRHGQRWKRFILKRNSIKFAAEENLLLIIRHISLIT